MTSNLARGLSFRAAVAAGLEPAAYDGLSVPEGEWRGTLDFKVWGKRPCLHCYLTAEDGGKYRLAVWFDRDYRPRDGGLDLSRTPPGTRLGVRVGRNRIGRVEWESAWVAEESGDGRNVGRSLQMQDSQNASKEEP